MAETKNIFLGIAAALFILGGILSPGLLPLVPVSLVCLALIAGQKFSSESTAARFFIILLSGLAVEFFSWLSNYLSKTENPALFHPLLFPDMLIALGLYAGLAAGWTVANRYLGFNIKEVFFLSAVYGVFIEQQGAVFLTFNPLAWLYVSLVYLSVVAPAFLLAPPSEPKRAAWKRYFLALAIITIAVILGLVLSNLLFGSFIPPKPAVAGI